MTAAPAREMHAASANRPARTARAGLRLVRLHLLSRRVPAALAAIAACAIGLRIALDWHWDTYGALQLPLIFEAASRGDRRYHYRKPARRTGTGHRPAAAVPAAEHHRGADR